MPGIETGPTFLWTHLTLGNTPLWQKKLGNQRFKMSHIMNNVVGNLYTLGFKGGANRHKTLFLLI
jgi:hypothetical protein